MRLLLVRHAIAEDHEEFAQTGQDDGLRPLTREGRFKMRRAANGMKRLVSTIDLLATSPLVRATQTTEIIAKAYRLTEVEVTPTLDYSAKLKDFLKWLKSHKDVETVACVGHEPHLGTLASWLLTGEERSFMTLKRGSACLLLFDGIPAAGGAILMSLVQPAELRRMAE